MRRRFLARIAALATAAAALGMFAVPASAEAADHQPDGCGDRGSDIGADAVASATTAGIGSILDGWANRDMDIDAFGSAMTQRAESLLDGWANRDLDIGALGSAMTQRAESLLDGWPNRDIDVDAFASAMIGPSAGSRVDGRANPGVDIGVACP